MNPVDLTPLAEYGMTGLLLMVIFAGGAFVCRWFMDAFKDCHNSTKAALEKSDMVHREVSDKVSSSINTLSVAVAKLEAKLEK